MLSKTHLMLRSARRARLEARTALLQLSLRRFGRFPDSLFSGGDEKKAAGVLHLLDTTLMSAFPSSRRANSWLSLKRLFWAVLGKAGGAAVMTTVDHTLMRGSKPHDR